MGNGALPLQFNLVGVVLRSGVASILHCFSALWLGLSFPLGVDTGLDHRLLHLLEGALHHMFDPFCADPRFDRTNSEVDARLPTLRILVPKRDTMCIKIALNRLAHPERILTEHPNRGAKDRGLAVLFPSVLIDSFLGEAPVVGEVHVQLPFSAAVRKVILTSDGISIRSLKCRRETEVQVNLQTKMKDVTSSFVQSFSRVHIFFGLGVDSNINDR